MRDMHPDIKKQFNFFEIDEIKPFVPLRDHLMKDDVVRGHFDPFYAECRAFGCMIEHGKDHELAVRCHGYMLLPTAIELEIESQFGIDDWNRGPADEGHPLRAIVKDRIYHNKSPFGKTSPSTMRSRLKQLNRLGIYNMDIREGNYLGGRLFDFSLAVTAPHLSLSRRIRDKSEILRDMRYDIRVFDDLMEDREAAKLVAKEQAIRKLRPRPDIIRT
jgi:hypothetical protein